jgi:hypothetical protein
MTTTTSMSRSVCARALRTARRSSSGRPRVGITAETVTMVDSFIVKSLQMIGRDFNNLHADRCLFHR